MQTLRGFDFVLKIPYQYYEYESLDEIEDLPKDGVVSYEIKERGFYYIGPKGVAWMYPDVMDKFNYGPYNYATVLDVTEAEAVRLCLEGE